VLEQHGSDSPPQHCKVVIYITTYDGRTYGTARRYIPRLAYWRAAG